MQWGFPVATWRGIAPTRSQEYKPGPHNGVDIMFRRDGVNDVEFKPGTPNGSRMFYMPDGVAVCAAADGRLWSAGWADSGYFVVLDHGPEKFATLYLHLETLDVPTTKAGTSQLRVSRGQRLGTVGASPKDGEGLKHLHFEIWAGGAAESHTDPWPYISGAPVPQSGWKRLLALFGGLLALLGLTRSKGGSG